MRHYRFLCIAIIFLICAANRSEADGHGGWHGGGGWGGGGWRGGYYGGGAVIVTPGYYDPYYYDGAYYNGYYGGPPYYGSTAYYDGGPGAGSVAVPVQEELARRGYYKGPIDGVVGPGTRAAISAYQRNHGLEVSGTIDAPLLRSLRI